MMHRPSADPLARRGRRWPRLEPWLDFVLGLLLVVAWAAVADAAHRATRPSPERAPLQGTDRNGAKAPPPAAATPASPAGRA